ncbi:MAG: acylneuraminate cytidylyltransferase family protein [Phycisphaerae bacterium]|nr:acylneuraminate cytidylyltransferase family protein [Phycisphaerae bacterium]
MNPPRDNPAPGPGHAPDSAGAIAIILARAGSKGVPGKNTAPLAGRPCVAWTIEHAQQTPGIARVVVSTDDPRVAEISRTMRAQVVARPADLAGDTATIDDAARHALTQLGNTHAAPIVILYANVPVRPRDLSRRALDRFAESGADSVQSFCRVGKHHPWWMVRVEDGGRLAPWQGDTLFHNVYRRQLLPPAFVPDGGVMVVSRRALFREIPGVADGPHAFLGLDRRAIETTEGDVVDIDTPTDLLVAGATLASRHPALEKSA